MKVLMFGWEFPPHNSGGLGVACQGLSRALSESGTEIIFVLPKKVTTHEHFKFVFAENVFLEIRTVQSLLSPYVTSDSYGKLFKEIGGGIYGGSLLEEVMRYAIRAKDIATKEGFDVIHAHDWLSFPAGIAAKEATSKPLVVHVHATEYDRAGGNAGDSRVHKIERMGMQKADRVVTVSEFTKHLIMEKYGVPEEKITVVHNGIETKDYPDRFKDDLGLMKLKKAGYKIVLFLGRITLMKGPDYFIRAAKRVLEYQPKTMFVVVGSGDMEGKMMQMASEMGISGNMLFVGFLRDADRSKIYHTADAYILPSVSEPFGITALESLLHKTPVIMSKQSGCSEVILHALKTDFWDTEEIADKILSVLTYPSMKAEMGKNGEQEAKGCGWDKAANKLQKVYQDLTP